MCLKREKQLEPSGPCILGLFNILAVSVIRLRNLPIGFDYILMVFVQLQPGSARSPQSYDSGECRQSFL